MTKDLNMNYSKTPVKTIKIGIEPTKNLGAGNGNRIVKCEYKKA